VSEGYQSPLRLVSLSKTLFFDKKALGLRPSKVRLPGSEFPEALLSTILSSNQEDRRFGHILSTAKGRRTLFDICQAP
jgi:hypothetical protein